MFKAIVLCASLALPAVAFAAGTPAPASQSMTRASKGGIKSLKGARSRSRSKRQGRGVAGKALKGSARRARSTRAKSVLAK